MYDESKMSWNENIIFSYNYAILGADFSNMRLAFKTSRGVLVSRSCVVLKEGPEKAEENIHLNAGRSGVVLQILQSNKHCQGHNGADLSWNTEVCFCFPWIFLLWYICREILSHRLCGLVELRRWANAGLGNCPSVCRTGCFPHTCSP